MLLPPYKRVIFKKNPLVNVSCHLQFYEPLTFDEASLNKLWESLRSFFPYLKLQNALYFASLDEASKFPQTIPRFASWSAAFLSKDNCWQLNVMSNQFSLFCTTYERWEKFRECLELTLEGLTPYLSKTCSRIDLRYIDVIQRSQLGLSEERWSNLLNPEIVGELKAFEEDIEHVGRELILNLNDKFHSKLHVRHGYTKLEGSDELCYLIDTDVYSQTSQEILHVYEILTDYRDYAGRFFHWCIQPKLRESMEPTEP